jgi:hypothetical protein
MADLSYTPGEDTDFQELIQRRANATAKQFGQVGGGTPAPIPSFADTMKADRATTAGQADRATKQAANQYSLAQKSGEQAGSLGDRMRAALFNRQRAVSQTGEAQREMGLTAGQDARGAEQDFKSKVGVLDYSKYKTDADRFDALQMAQKQGTLNLELLGMAREGSLKMADIDRAFQLKYYEIENAFKDWEAMTQQELKARLDKLANDAKSTAEMINGFAGVGGALLSKWGSKA